MAQWMGQFSGINHQTKVQDIEESLRQAGESIKALPEDERTSKLKAIHHLAERLLTTRLKLLRARISALTEPSLRPRNNDVSHLRMREQELQAEGANGILKEFGICK